MIGEALGSNWRDEYVVWDCASGTNNLTRDYSFKELYCSTLEQGDVNTVKDCGYNRGSTVFQYDFLNDDEVDVLGPKIPVGLKAAFESGKKILFFINPPYGTANEFGMQEGKHKAGTAKTRMNTTMNDANMGACSQQLYAQFMYRILKLSQKYPNVSLGMFSSPLFIAGSSFVELRRQWYQQFKISDGMLFQASHFADVKGTWGIAFTVWKNGKMGDTGATLRLKDLSPDTFTVQKIGDKTIYNAEGRQASKWVREPLKGMPTFDAPQFSSVVAFKQEGRGTTVEGSLGYFANNANSVYDNATTVFLVSGTAASSHGLPCHPINFDRVTALFTARKAVGVEWFNSKDEYLVPNTAHPDYAQWNADAIVYSLFNTASQQSSLRQIAYKGKRWDIHNSFFFMSNAEMRALADKSGFQEMYEDSKHFPDDIYVYKLLQSTKLSEDASIVLEAARELIRLSMSLRETYHDENPKQHLQAWSAGWAQLKPLLKEHFKPQYDAFVVLYKKFEDRMREGVYKFGFLK